MTEIPLRLDPAVARLVHVGWVRAEPVLTATTGASLPAEIASHCRDLAGRYAGLAPGQIEGLAPARDLYKSFGIDPTRTRPSSEALLRRVLRGLPFPQILDAVDLGNLCSLLFLLPIGLYDAALVEGPVILRRGLPGESYAGIRKDDVHLEGRPVLVDARGPFGNPTSDSSRTQVSERTTSLWMTVFAPRSVPSAVLATHARTAASLIERHLRGSEDVRSTTGVVVQT